MTNIQTCCGLRHSSSMERKLILKFIHRRAGDAWKPATLLHLTILMPSLFNTFHEDSAKFHPSVSRWYLENPVPFFIWRSWCPVWSPLFMNLDTSSCSWWIPPSLLNEIQIDQSGGFWNRSLSKVDSTTCTGFYRGSWHVGIKASKIYQSWMTWTTLKCTIPFGRYC